jgi:hypothetical protein
MASYAKIDENNIVVQVISCDEEMAKLLPEPETWIQTSRNTRGGVHLIGGTPLRMNYAVISSTYDKEKDAFIPYQIFPSWVLDEKTCLWKAPIAMPIKDGYEYAWDEENKTWVEVEIIPEPDTP